ncbi:hypothetical protein BY458DRAFT_514861 [Sporodiniella umbellata]|nr:hypothetical protein BY458DRAFT_514861 [Sporodiniella umbellata]
MMSSTKPTEEKTRRRRLKVISACGECRRKKTKCDGEQPCSGCLKAHVNCQYTINQKLGASMSIIREKLNNNINLIAQPIPKQEIALNKHIKDIEARLSMVEDVLRDMLGSQLAPIKSPAIKNLLNDDDAPFGFHRVS